MRLFGMPSNHPARLENHTGIRSSGFMGSQWKVVIAGRSFVGVIQYYILSFADPSKALVMVGEAMVGLGSTSMPEAAWYLIPIPPYGWDIVNATNGFRLNATATSGLEMSPALTGLTHWDILRPGRTKGFHRSHFWLPPFFMQAFCNQPRTYSPMSQMEPLVGNLLGPGGKTTTEGETEALAACTKEITCNTLCVRNDGQVTRWQGWNPDPKQAAPDPVQGPVARMCGSLAITIERERQLFGDTRPRGTAGRSPTGEYSEWWSRMGRPPTGVVLYQRRAPPSSNTEAYRSCMVQLGMDAPECESFLFTAATTAHAQYTLQKSVLEQVTGQPQQPGLCGPDKDHPILGVARLWSKTCTEFCKSNQAREEGSCRNGLLAYCQTQDNSDGLQDPMCSCYLSTESYREIRAKANQKLGSTSPVAAKINEVIANNKMKEYCWYGPCHEQANRPADSTCPGGDVIECTQLFSDCQAKAAVRVQVSSDNQYTSGGNQSHSQKCEIAGNAAISTGSDANPASLTTQAAGGRQTQVGVLNDESTDPDAVEQEQAHQQQQKVVIGVALLVVVVLIGVMLFL
jgi:hypothetical protein